MIPPIELRPRTLVTRETDHGFYFELSEQDIPTHNGTSNSTRTIIDYLDVSNEKHLRYHRKGQYVQSHVYVHDYARLMGAYLPRVWWTKDALLNRKFSIPELNKSIKEISANELYDWFQEWGAQFGWREIDTTEGQIRANQGECVVMVAGNRNYAGHCVAIVPETGDVRCMNTSGIIHYPVMSHASLVNKKYFCSKWWNTYERPRVYVYKK